MRTDKLQAVLRIESILPMLEKMFSQEKLRVNTTSIIEEYYDYDNKVMVKEPVEYLVILYDTTSGHITYSAELLRVKIAGVHNLENLINSATKTEAAGAWDTYSVEVIEQLTPYGIFINNQDCADF